MALVDRTLHGRSVYGRAIVRYDRAGKWYVERDDLTLQRVTIDHAARLAADGEFFPGQPGGRLFDGKVRRLRAAGPGAGEGG